MNKKAIIVITFLTACSLIGMIFFQIFWVKQAVYLQEKQFNHRVIVAMNKAIDKLYENEKRKPKTFENGHFEQAINVIVQGSINKRLLDSLIKSEFAYQQIDLDFKFGILKCEESEAIMQSDDVSAEKLFSSKFKCQYAYYKSDCYNLSIHFPALRHHLLKEAGIIAISPFIIILIFGICFAYVIKTVFKQKKLSEIKTDFINNMTHEFKTPISTISLASEVLLEPEIAGNQEKSSHYAKIIHVENNRLKNQVEQVLQMAVIDKGKLNFKIQRVDVHAIIEEVVSSFELQVQEKDGALNKALNASLHHIDADELHLKNVIYNLIDNAIKYSNEELSVEVSTENNDLGINIKVKDSGCGIKQADQKQIFQKFYRVPTGDVHDVKGFGLGLNYVQAIVDNFNGELTVKSELHKGSEFVIFLPFKAQS